MQDTNNYIYAGSFEQNAINVFNPANGSVSTYVRDPRIGWTDSMWISNEKYLYFIENQLWRTPVRFEMMMEISCIDHIIDLLSWY